jgi:hypothetical protein
MISGFRSSNSDNVQESSLGSDSGLGENTGSGDGGYDSGPYQDAGASFGEALPVTVEEDDPAETLAPTLRERLTAAAAIAVVLGWSGLVVAAHAPQMQANVPLAQWSQWALEWAVPSLLVLCVYLIATQTSRRAASHFVAASQLLRQEAEQLEARLHTVNRELSLAREFLSSQSRDLDALGRLAVERISAHGDHLAALVRDNAEQVESIGSVSQVAVGNMEQLRDQLPVIAAATKDVTSNIAHVGRVAQTLTQELAREVDRMGEHAQATDSKVSSLRDDSDTALGLLEMRMLQLESTIRAQFDALDQRSTGFALDLERHHAESLQQMRDRAARLAEEISANRRQLDQQEAEAITSLRARVSALRDEGATIARSMREVENSALDDWRKAMSTLDEELNRFDGLVGARQMKVIERAQQLGALSEQTSVRLAQAEARIEAISIADHVTSASMEQRLTSLERRLSETGQTLEQLTEASVRLLELIQSTAQHSRDQLPPALAESEARLVAFSDNIQRLRGEIEGATTSGEALAARVGAAQGALLTTSTEIDTLQASVATRIASHGEGLAMLRHALSALDSDCGRLAEHAQGELKEAITSLATALRASVDTIESEGAARVTQMAERLAEESCAAVERQMRARVEDIAVQLEQATTKASGLGAEAARMLRQEIAEVDAMAAHLERRVADARDSAQDKADNDFARRMAVIADTLQSEAVDIAKVLDSDVADTSWAAYLRGDRGIFTRRAVKLLDATEARQILQLYESDSSFQTHVNRYIHDFEAMLRIILATRDGHAVSVTLLSSDMGKLYVALAQAIERLRG